MEKNCFILIVLLVFSVSSLLFSNTSGISFNTGAATLYEDGSDSSFLYEAFLSSNSPVGNVDLSFSSAYSGLIFSTEHFSCMDESVFLDAGLSSDFFNAGLFAIVSDVPGVLSISTSKLSFTQNGLSFWGAGFSFDWIFSSDFNPKIIAMAGCEDTLSGDLYIVSGTLTLPFFALLRTSVLLSLKMEAGAGSSFVKANLATSLSDFGDASIYEWDVFFKKGFSWDFSSGTSDFHASLDLIFSYAGLYAKGDAVLLPYMADYPFFPFTYLHLEGEGVLHTAFFCSDFTIKKGNFAFDASVALLADVFSRIRASYKYILQKTVVYDGSSAKDSFLNDSCMRDYIALISLKASYDIRIPFFGEGHFISIYAGKKLPLPMISRPTRDFFEGASSDSESSIEYDASRLAKAILFSGLEIGLTLKF